MSKSSLLPFLLFMSLSFAFCQSEKTVREGVRILNEKGAATARAYFQEMVDEEKNLEAAFYLAWCHYRLGKTNAAEEINDAILQNTKDEWILSKGNYLKGLIAYSDGNYSDARAYLGKAIQKTSSKRDRSHMVALVGACMIAEKRYEDAKNYLEKVGVENGFGWDLMSKAYVGLKDYKAALEFNDKALKWYQANKNNLNYHDSLSQRGFIRFLIGDKDGGHADTVLVDEFCAENQATMLSYYNAINWVLIRRCSDLEFTEISSKIEAYIEESGDNTLEDLLSFALNWGCAPFLED